MSASEHAEIRADGCRRRILELAAREPITRAHAEAAAQRAAEAKAYANQARETSARATAWVAELRKRQQHLTTISPKSHERSN